MEGGWRDEAWKEVEVRVKCQPDSWSEELHSQGKNCTCQYNYGHYTHIP